MIGYDKVYKKALDAGWIRISVGNWVINIELIKPTIDAKDALKRKIMKNYEGKSFCVDLMKSEGYSFYNGALMYKQFETRDTEELLQYIDNLETK